MIIFSSYSVLFTCKCYNLSRSRNLHTFYGLVTYDLCLVFLAFNSKFELGILAVLCNLGIPCDCRLIISCVDYCDCVSVNLGTYSPRKSTNAFYLLAFEILGFQFRYGFLRFCSLDKFSGYLLVLEIPVIFQSIAVCAFACSFDFSAA